MVMTRMSSGKTPRAARLSRARFVGILLALLPPPPAAIAAEYAFSNGPVTATWTGGSSWHGRHALPGVYCVQFPQPERAKSFSEGFLNGNAISYARAVYIDRLAAYVVTSTLPQGRTEAEEFRHLQDIERRSAEATGGRYRVSLSGDGFGPVIELQLHDMAEQHPEGPFPLVRAQLSNSGKPPVSISAHRLFVRGPDRIEVAVLAGADDASRADDGAALRQKVNAFADELLASLQACTAEMPGRAVTPGGVP